MSFASRFLLGASAAAGVTYYYSININQQAAQLSASLHALSEQLVAQAPRHENPADWSVPIPQRAGLKEDVKARWNEQVLAGISVVRDTEWTKVAASSFGAIKAKLTPAPEVVVEDQGRQV